MDTLSPTYMCPYQVTLKFPGRNSSDQSSMRFPVSTLLTLLTLLISTANAAECTDSEATYADSLWDAAAANSACSPYVVTTNPVYINAPCSTSCIPVMEDVAEKLPSCTFSGVSNKIELQNSLTVCNGGDTTDPGSPTTTTDTTSTSTTTTTPTPTSSSTTDCTTDEYQSTEDLYDTAAATSACSPYSTSSSLLVTFDTPCSATDCIDVLVQLAADLPDCLYDGANQKTELTDNLGVCTDAADTSTPTSTSAPTSGDTSTSPTPASTASSSGCTTTEVKDMWDLYISTATSDECSADSTVNGYSVYIFTSCDSECASKVKDLAEALPNCYYDYEFMNKKQDVLEELDDCEESVNNYISITIYPDSSIEFTSSSASSSKTDSESQVTSDTDSEPLMSGDPSDTTSDSSRVGNAESAASRAKSQLWFIVILLTATIIAF